MQARTKSLYACKTVPFGTPVIKEMCKIMAPFTENLSRIRATANCNDTGAYLLDELLWKKIPPGPFSNFWSSTEKSFLGLRTSCRNDSSLTADGTSVIQVVLRGRQFPRRRYRGVTAAKRAKHNSFELVSGCKRMYLWDCMSAPRKFISKENQTQQLDTIFFLSESFDDGGQCSTFRRFSRTVLPSNSRNVFAQQRLMRRKTEELEVASWCVFCWRRLTFGS